MPASSQVLYSDAGDAEMKKQFILKGLLCSGKTSLKHDLTPVVRPGDKVRHRMICPRRKRAPKPGWELGRVSGDQERLSGGGETRARLTECSGVSHSQSFVKVLRA